MITYLITLLLTTSITELPEVVVYSNQSEINNLAKLICAEANLEPDYGKELVVATVIYRARLKKTSINHQIFRSNIDRNGKTQYQYDGITTKYFKRNPTVNHIKLAQKVYNNINNYPKVYYYVNEEIATDSKFVAKLYRLNLYLFKVGNHTFFKKE